MARKLGLNAKLYRNPSALTSTTYSASGWDEIPNVQDLTLSIEAGEADTSVRANNGWATDETTLKRGSVEFSMVYDTGDPDFTALKDAFMNNTEVAMAVMDGAIATTGNQGLVANFKVGKFERVENLQQSIMYNISIRPSSYPFWQVIA